MIVATTSLQVTAGTGLCAGAQKAQENGLALAKALRDLLEVLLSLLKNLQISH